MSKIGILILLFVLTDTPVLASNFTQFFSANSSPTKVTKRIFITSTTYDGAAVGGVSGANSKCQTVATSAALSGTWKALISSSTVMMKDQLPINWDVLVNLIGQTVMTKENALTPVRKYWTSAGVAADFVLNPINYNEFGVLQPGHVWTGVVPSADSHLVLASGQNCSNWTTASASFYGISGNTSSAQGAFQEANLYQCDNAFRLYCVEQ